MDKLQSTTPQQPAPEWGHFFEVNDHNKQAYQELTSASRHPAKAARPPRQPTPEADGFSPSGRVAQQLEKRDQPDATKR